CAGACEKGEERAPDPRVADWASVSLTFKDGPLPPLSITLSPKLLSMLAAPPPLQAAQPAETTGPAEPAPVQADPQGAVSPTMDLLMDVELPVSISFGKTHLPMKDVLKLTTGSIVELNRGVNETVEVMVN